MTDKQLLDIFKALSNETRLHILQWLKTPDEIPDNHISAIASHKISS